MSELDGERIAKVIARAGICSRRDAERLIGEGRALQILDAPIEAHERPAA